MFVNIRVDFLCQDDHFLKRNFPGWSRKKSSKFPILFPQKEFQTKTSLSLGHLDQIWKMLYKRKYSGVWKTKKEPPHDKTNKITVHPAKTQISLDIRPVWSESSLWAQWVGQDPRTVGKTLIKLGGYPGWSVFAVRTCHYIGFVMRRLRFVASWLCVFFFLEILLSRWHNQRKHIDFIIMFMLF